MRGIKKFDPDINIARAWERLMENNYVAQDLLWLQHEYMESLIMEGTSVSWREAHDIVNQIYNWDNTLK